MSIQQARNSVKSRDVIEGIRSRIVSSLAKPDDYVRVTVTPHPDDNDYKPEDGVSIRVPVGEPYAPSGAGRSGYVVNRRIYVYVATGLSGLLDYAGNDQIAAYAHLDLEDSVADAILDFPGGGVQTKLGIRVKWVEGGAEIGRRFRNDPSMLVSVLLFDVEYPAPFRVNRD